MMDREDIKAALRKRGSSLSVIARNLKIDPSAVSHVLMGERSKRVESAIAVVLGKPVEKIWPSRYASRRKS